MVYWSGYVEDDGRGPVEDRGVIPISVQGPQGVDVQYMDMQMRQVEAAVMGGFGAGPSHVPGMDGQLVVK